MKKTVAMLSLLTLLVTLPVYAAGSDTLINAGQEGQKFDFQPKLVKGKINIIDFYSPYCPPCRRIMPLLSKLAEVDPDVVVLRLDINRPKVDEIDFTSPLAQQYHLNSVPNFKIYGKDGKLQAEGDAAYGAVIQMLQKYKVVPQGG